MRTVFFLEDRKRRHDVRDGGLVVGAEHGRAVGDDDVVALVAFDFGVFLHANPEVFGFVLKNVAPLVVFNDLRVNDGGKTHVDRVHVHHPADGGRTLAFGEVARKLRREHGVLGNFNVDESEFGELLREEFRKIPFGGVARDDARLGVRLGADRRVTLEARQKFGFLVHGKLLGVVVSRRPLLGERLLQWSRSIIEAKRSFVHCTKVQGVRGSVRRTMPPCPCRDFGRVRPPLSSAESQFAGGIETHDRSTQKRSRSK